jgi:poly(3-hydroxybutyrate) depolymerase
MIGLLGMRERATVEPTAGGGTTVLARVPLSLTEVVDSDGGEPQDPFSIDEADVLSVGVNLHGSDDPTSHNRIQELQAVAARDGFIAPVAHEIRPTSCGRHLQGRPGGRGRRRGFVIQPSHLLNYGPDIHPVGQAAQFCLQIRPRAIEGSM